MNRYIVFLWLQAHDRSQSVKLGRLFRRMICESVLLEFLGERGEGMIEMEWTLVLGVFGRGFRAGPPMVLGSRDCRHGRERPGEEYTASEAASTRTNSNEQTL